jgi:hypothetical protein
MTQDRPGCSRSYVIQLERQWLVREVIVGIESVIPQEVEQGVVELLRPAFGHDVDLGEAAAAVLGGEGRAPVNADVRRRVACSVDVYVRSGIGIDVIGEIGRHSGS